MTAPRWRLREVHPNAWWAVDEEAGTAYHVDDAIARRLWAREELLARPLPAAIRDVMGPDSAPPDGGEFVDLRFVAVTVRYRSPDATIVSRIAHDFAGARVRLRSSPDIIVELSSGVDPDRLHRSAPDGRPGVVMRPASANKGSPVSGDFPVVPPLEHTYFVARYTAVHAALMATRMGNVVVCGARRSGKTTTATLCGRLGLAEVLTDEMVLLDNTGHAFGLAMPIRERTADGRLSSPLQPTDVGVRLVPVDHVVVLEPTPHPPRIRIVTDLSEALPLIAPHLRPLGGPLGLATDNLLTALRRADVRLWQVRAWPDLHDDIVAAATDLLGDPVS